MGFGKGGFGSLPKENLSQLTNLLEKGDEQGFFSARMPPDIERAIHEENINFIENKDIYSKDYYLFIMALIKKYSRKDDEHFKEFAMKLAVKFLFNTYLHLKERDMDLVAEVKAIIVRLIEAKG